MKGNFDIKNPHHLRKPEMMGKYIVYNGLIQSLTTVDTVQVFEGHF